MGNTVQLKNFAGQKFHPIHLYIPTWVFNIMILQKTTTKNIIIQCHVGHMIAISAVLNLECSELC